jgi:hypothetical protein
VSSLESDISSSDLKLNLSLSDLGLREHFLSSSRSDRINDRKLGADLCSGYHIQLRIAAGSSGKTKVPE